MDETQSSDRKTGSDSSIKGLLEWLALTHGHPDVEDTEGLLQQLLNLREAPIAPSQRVKLLELLYAHSETLVRNALPQLRVLSLPIPRKTRQRVRLILELLETLTQDHFNTLASLFDPKGNTLGNGAQSSLRRAMQAIAWQIHIHHLVAAPARPGLWQELHAAMRTAQRLGVEQLPGPRDSPSIQRLYTNILLAAIAQPASFSADELSFIHTLVEQLPDAPALSASPADPINSNFWIDLERDFPAHALARRTPSPDVKPVFFSTATQAQAIARIRAQLTAGTAPAALGLPEFAATHDGFGVLRRLERLWGEPAKRKFPRRRQSYRTRLCAGLDAVYRILKSPSASIDDSEWMVTNESPEGFALMHMAGSTSHLRLGDIVAIQTQEERASGNWHVCIIRWAISENPEHVELGLQLLAPAAIPVCLALPKNPAAGQTKAVLLPEAPPLRPGQSLIAPPGLLREDSREIILIVERENLRIREVRAIGIDEQTGALEIFPIRPDSTD